MAIFKYRESPDSPWKKIQYRMSALASEIMTRSGKSVQQEIDKIPSMISNPNLLDNGWFAVNQRGQTSYTTEGYTVDRWKHLIDIGTVSIDEDGIILDATSHAVTLGQFPDTDVRDSLIGKTVTLSVDYTVLTQGGSASSTGLATSSGYDRKIVLDGSVNTRRIKSQTFEGYSSVESYGWFYAPFGNRIKVHSVKLEYGSVSTLANDHAPDYATELLKCQSSTADPSDTYANRPYGMNLGLSLEEIEASTDLTGKIASAQAVKDVDGGRWESGNVGYVHYVKNKHIARVFVQGHNDYVPAWSNKVVATLPFRVAWSTHVPIMNGSHGMSRGVMEVDGSGDVVVTAWEDTLEYVGGLGNASMVCGLE